MAAKKKASPKMLGSGLANKAAKALKGRAAQLAAAEEAAVGKKKGKK
jgi:hypothetical protein